MKHLTDEELEVLRKSVAYYLDVLDDDKTRDEHEYNVLEKIYNELVDSTFNK